MLRIIKKYKYVISFIIVLIIICLVVVRNKMLKEKNIEFVTIENNDLVKGVDIDSENMKEEKIKADIKGQVLNPGVYELEKGSRVIDLINVSGGLTEMANTSLINLSKVLEDQMVVIIYSNEEVANSNVKEIETVYKIIEKECVCPNIKNDSCINTELEDATSDNNSNEEDNKLININTASLEELMSLPSIGESKAKSIIEYREKNIFNTIDDIMNVSGIGEALFEKIKEYITI